MLNAEFHPTGQKVSITSAPAVETPVGLEYAGGTAGVTRPAAQLAGLGLVQQAEHEVPLKHSG